jgi:flagellar biosynthesis/type III secretory pathway protein FliH
MTAQILPFHMKQVTTGSRRPGREYPAHVAQVIERRRASALASIEVGDAIETTKGRTYVIGEFEGRKAGLLQGRAVLSGAASYPAAGRWCGMSQQRIINSPHFEKVLKDVLQTRMLEAAEPVVKEALEKFEKNIRAEIAKAVLTIIDRNYSVETLDSHLVIKIVRHPGLFT